MTPDFSAYSGRYREEMERSIGFIGQDVDFFAAVKAGRLIDLARRRLGDPATLAALDVGCGVGLTDRHLTQSFARVVGVDIAQGMIDEAARANPSAQYLLYDGRHLPFADGAIDLAFAISVFHHVPHPLRPNLVREMARVVRPNGLVVIIEHNPLNPLTRRAVAHCAWDEDAVLLGRRETRLLFESARLDLIEQRYIVFFPFFARQLTPVERALGWLPLGAQHYVAARRSAGP